MKETILFDEQGITVTDIRLLVYGQPYLLRDVRAAEVRLGRQDRVILIIMAVCGAMAMVYGAFTATGAALILGVMVAVVAGLASRVQDVRHRLWFETTGGAVEIFSHPDADFLQRVADALNQVLAANAAPPPA